MRCLHHAVVAGIALLIAIATAATTTAAAQTQGITALQYQEKPNDGSWDSLSARTLTGFATFPPGDYIIDRGTSTSTAVQITAASSLYVYQWGHTPNPLRLLNMSAEQTAAANRTEHRIALPYNQVSIYRYKMSQPNDKVREQDAQYSVDRRLQIQKIPFVSDRRFVSMIDLTHVTTATPDSSQPSAGLVLTFTEEVGLLQHSNQHVHWYSQRSGQAQGQSEYPASWHLGGSSLPNFIPAPCTQVSVGSKLAQPGRTVSIHLLSHRPIHELIAGITYAGVPVTNATVHTWDLQKYQEDTLEIIATEIRDELDAKTQHITQLQVSPAQQGEDCCSFRPSYFGAAPAGHYRFTAGDKDIRATFGNQLYVYQPQTSTTQLVLSMNASDTVRAQMEATAASPGENDHLYFNGTHHDPYDLVMLRYSSFWRDNKQPSPGMESRVMDLLGGRPLVSEKRYASTICLQYFDGRNTTSGPIRLTLNASSATVLLPYNSTAYGKVYAQDRTEDLATNMTPAPLSQQIHIVDFPAGPLCLGVVVLSEVPVHRHIITSIKERTTSGRWITSSTRIVETWDLKRYHESLRNRNREHPTTVHTALSEPELDGPTTRAPVQPPVVRDGDSSPPGPGVVAGTQYPRVGDVLDILEISTVRHTIRRAGPGGNESGEERKAQCTPAAAGVQRVETPPSPLSTREQLLRYITKGAAP